MNTTNLTNEEKELCKDGGWYSRYPVIIRKGNYADNLGLTSGNLCLEFLNEKAPDGISKWSYEVDDSYDLSKPEGMAAFEAASKDALVFDTTDFVSFKKSQKQSTQTLKELLGRQMAAQVEHDDGIEM